MSVKVVSNKDELKDAYSVRYNVFVKEQNVPEDLEIDEFENSSTHFVMYDDRTPIGAGRIRPADGYGKVERICISSSYRGKGLGKSIMKFIEDTAPKLGFNQLKLNSQTHAEQFYKSIGYETISGEFMDAGIPHVTMIKKLN